MAKYISQRAIQRQKRRFRKKVIFFVFLVLGVVGLLVWIFNLDKLEIKEVSIEGDVSLSQEQMLSLVETEMAGKYFGLIPKDNFLVYPKESMLTVLEKEFPKIKTVAIKLEKFQELKINISERKPYALWCCCREAEQCYFMDGLGFLYELAPTFSDNVYFRYIDGIGEIATSTLPKEVLTKTYLAGEKEWFDEMNLFIRLLKDININGYELITTDNENYELLFGNESSLRFKKGENLGDIFENLQATLIDLGNLEGKEFEYIDLRFDNKVIYKFRGE